MQLLSMKFNQVIAKTISVHEGSVEEQRDRNNTRPGRSTSGSGGNDLKTGRNDLRAEAQSGR